MMAAWDLAAHADVAELVDALDLGSSAERRGGSSPFIRTSCLAIVEKHLGDIRRDAGSGSGAVLDSERLLYRIENVKHNLN